LDDLSKRVFTNLNEYPEEKGCWWETLNVQYSKSGELLVVLKKDLKKDIEKQLIRSLLVFVNCTKKTIRTLSCKNKIQCADICSDGKTLAYGDWDGVLTVKDLESESCKRYKWHQLILGLAFSPDGKKVVICFFPGLYYNNAIIKDLVDNSYEEVCVRALHATWNFDGTKIFFEDIVFGGTAMYDCNQRKCVFENLDKNIKRAAFSPFDKLFVGGSDIGPIDFWQIEKAQDGFSFKKLEQELKEPEFGVSSPRFSGDGKNLAIGLNRGILLEYNVADIFPEQMMPSERSNILPCNVSI